MDGPEDYAANDRDLADQLEKIAAETGYEFGAEPFGEIDVRFYRAELEMVIKVLRGGSHA